MNRRTFMTNVSMAAGGAAASSLTPGFPAVARGQEGAIRAAASALRSAQLRPLTTKSTFQNDD